MDRRKFVAAGAGVLAVTASGAAAGVLGDNRAGERVTLSGWITPASRGPGHYFVLGPDAGVADPSSEQVEQWPSQLTLVLPADATKMRPGKATVQGRLFRGRFVDHATGRASAAVLTDAALV
jgi:hypothetical protein